LYAEKEKSIIPVYSLQESSELGSRLFEVRELNNPAVHRDPSFFLPHRKDYYFFFLVKKGYNRHWIDFVSYEVKPRHLYFTVPQQVHLKERSEPVQGTLLTFTDEFLALQDQNLLKHLPILQNLDDRHEIALDDADISFLDNLLMQMLAEFNQQNDWKKSMLQSYLEIFLVYLSRIYTKQFNVNSAAANGQALVKRMKNLLDEQYAGLHQVSDYAQQLNVTPGHLNDTIKQHTGKNATTIIQERIMLEAKRILFHTDLPVKEIAWRLGFEDAAYFNRFFKRLAAETPMQFRGSIREKYS
jgi:AraC family transcriptional activator of pobA